MPNREQRRYLARTTPREILALPAIMQIPKEDGLYNYVLCCSDCLQVVERQLVNIGTVYQPNWVTACCRKIARFYSFLDIATRSIQEHLR